MNMFEEARAIKATMQLCSLTQSEVARQLGVSQSYVANKLRLLSLSEDMQKRIIESCMSERHARCLLRLKSEEERTEVLKKIIERNLTVRECEALVGTMLEKELPKTISRADELDRIDAFLRTLSSCLDTLRSFGISASQKKSYYGDKMYVTLCIENC